MDRSELKNIITNAYTLADEAIPATMRNPVVIGLMAAVLIERAFPDERLALRDALREDPQRT